jgi:integrase
MGEPKRIGLREVKALKPGEIVWDGTVRGFAARRQRSEAVSYVLQYRNVDGRQRWLTIGRHGAPWTPDTARDEAKRLLGAVASGTDPAAVKARRRAASTVAELLDNYLADATEGRLLVRGGKPKKPSTLASDKGRINGHIRPLLGKLKVAAVTRADIDAMMHAIADGETRKQAKTKTRGKSIIRGGRGVATRTIGLAGAIFAYAIEHGMRSDNPAHGVRKFAENKRERRLTDYEYKLLAEALERAEAAKIWPPAIAATKFLALTGWRSGEALTLTWDNVDRERRIATLPDTKTGKSVRPLSVAALEALAGQEGGKVVFRPSRGKTTMTGFGRFWDKIAAKGPLPLDISPHVLRHSFASVAADLGYSEVTIAALIGHKGHSVTSRYVHAADVVLLAAADAVATDILRRMGLVSPATNDAGPARPSDPADPGNDGAAGGTSTSRA